MGLDGVELIMRFEKEFRVAIPDPEAENMGCLGDVVKWLYHHISIVQPPKPLYNHLAQRLETGLHRLGITEQMAPQRKLTSFIPDENILETWQLLSQYSGLQLPSLAYKEVLKTKKNKFSLFKSQMIPCLPDLRFQQLVECAGALEYKNLIDFDCITSLFEITIAIMGIIEELIGVGIQNIRWEASFVHDLGIN